MLFVLLLGQVSLLAQKDYALLPKPQQMEVKGGNFLLNQVKLNTPVLEAEWKALVAELGGRVNDKATQTIAA